MTQITIDVPEVLAEKLASVHDRLPEVLAHGLGELSPLPNEVYRYLLEFLTSDPMPETVLNFRPTSRMQDRISELLEHNRQGQLSPAESAELDEYERIEHCIRMMKIQASKEQKNTP